MLISIQFPIADSRIFLNEPTGVLGRPTWPSPDPYSEFVRSFGGIKVRGRGGVQGWVGENEICEAKHAIRFLSFPSHMRRCAFRRLYSDGAALRKYEIGITNKRYYGSEFHEYYESEFCPRPEEADSRFLATPIEIRQPTGPAISCELGEAGSYLAKLYKFSSTSHKTVIKAQDWWVTAGCPILFVELGEIESLSYSLSSLKVHKVQIPEDYGIELCYFRLPYKGKEIPAWVVNRDLYYYYRTYHFPTRKQWSRIRKAASDLSFYKARNLRLYLLRLHAEHQCLKIILRNIANDNIPVAQGTKATETLQWYLNEATKRISRWESKSKGLIDTDVGDLARISEDAISPGQRDSLLALLERENIRLNVRRKIEKYANVVVQKGATLHMVDKIEQGDTYNIGGNAKIGAVGRNASVDYADFREIWTRIGDTINLQMLAADLSKLLPELRNRAADSTHDESVVAVGQALQAAEEKNGPKALEYLKKSGKWALNVATEIGVTVAAEVMKQVLS